MEKELRGPEVYTDDEIDALEAHIEKHFGTFNSVFHEIASPDIHVDICIIPPSKEHDFYTLVTMGMGAHKMNIPEELADKQLDRAEILVILPSDWDINNHDEKWYWPIRWLKILARLPIDNSTWLGWGHSIPSGGAFANNTQLSGVLLEFPYRFGRESEICKLPNGDEINFYQMIPLYEEEMRFKTENGTNELTDLFDDAFSDIVEVTRKNYCALMSKKKWAIASNQIKPLLDWDGPEGCIATDRILVDGCKVGFMYREKPDENEPDSGWRFMAGDEDDTYMDNPENSGVYTLNTICNYDPKIISFLHADYGTAYYRDKKGVFHRDKEWTTTD